MQTNTGGPSTQANLKASHVLFVEGSHDDAFDPTVLKELTAANGLSMLRVHAVGPCDDIASAAKAMAYQHKHYYFVVDRDGRSHEFVENSWVNFPTPTTHNLLVWRKRELENYFIDPNYLRQTSFLKQGKTQADLERDILKEAQARLYLEAANMVLFHDIRPELLKPAAIGFKNPQEFKDRATTLVALQSCVGLSEKGLKVANILAPELREERLDFWLQEFTDGASALTFGKGKWLDLMSGKQIFKSIASRNFEVKDNFGTTLKTAEQNAQIAKELLRRPLIDQPTDFQKIVELMRLRVLDNPGSPTP